ncbi:MAG: DUF4340 domain-containing protein [Gammaproteobacteria bacterium]|nr:DUF4340 domain-containing protein [Gammaproteobacteria bacterium]
MARRLLLNLMLAIVVLGLALFIYIDPDKATDDNRSTISNIDPDSVSSIKITRLQGEPLSFVKRDGQWFIVGQTEYRADDFQVGTLLALLRSVTDRKYPASTLDLKPMGLMPPLVDISFDDARFEIGTTEPIDRNRYVMHDTTVYLVPDRFQHLLNARYTNFIDRRLLPPGAVVTRLELPGLSLQRDSDMNWQLQPEDKTVGADAIRTLVSDWENARALYVREASGYLGETLRVHLQGVDEALEFTLQRDYKDIILSRPDRGIQYHLAGDAGLKLLEFMAEPDS